MTQRLKSLRAGCVAALIALLPAFAAPAQDLSLISRVDPGAGFSSVSRGYSDMDHRYVRVGTERTIANVRSVAMGLTLQELRGPLGQPAYGFGDGSYEYILSLPLTGADRLICQYRVYFDDAGGMERAVWRRPQCAELVLGR